jgi:Fic family protein
VIESVDWSKVAHEELTWAFTNESVVPHRDLRRARGPYRAAIAPKIAELAQLSVSPETIVAVAEAANEISRFDSEFGNDLVPFSAILLRSESAASSKIENLSATAQSIFLAEMGDPSKRNARIIVANAAAMASALRMADNIDGDAILEMHLSLLAESQPNTAGRWRDQQVWIGGGDFSPHDALFVPPHHSRVEVGIADLLRFIARDDIPAIALVAIAHAQFETIHPFPDGNGRVGRALMHAILKAKGLTRNILVPVSAGLLSNVGEYFDALTQYREGDHEPIVNLTANACFRSVTNGRQLVHEIREVQAEWRELIQARTDAAVWRLAESLVRQPVIDSLLVQQELSLSAQNANTAIAQLESIGVLTKIAGNFRYRKWAAKDVLSALDRFAERAGRRQVP